LFYFAPRSCPPLLSILTAATFQSTDDCFDTIRLLRGLETLEIEGFMAEYIDTSPEVLADLPALRSLTLTDLYDDDEDVLKHVRVVKDCTRLTALSLGWSTHDGDENPVRGEARRLGGRGRKIR
jgi:hypothetical protein